MKDGWWRPSFFDRQCVLLLRKKEKTWPQNYGILLVAELLFVFRPRKSKIRSRGQAPMF